MVGEGSLAISCKEKSGKNNFTSIKQFKKEIDTILVNFCHVISQMGRKLSNHSKTYSASSFQMNLRGKPAKSMKKRQQ